MPTIRHPEVYTRTRPPKQTPPPPRLLKIKEAADRLSISVRTMYKMIEDGILPYVSVGSNGRGKRVDEKDLLKYIRNNKKQEV